MIDALAPLLWGAFEVVCVMIMVWVGASVLVGALATEDGPAVTDDWERKNLGGGR